MELMDDTMRNYIKLSNEIQRCELLAGDHIYSYRKAWAYLFSHHGIYVGGDKVIHFMGDTTLMNAVSSARPDPAQLNCQACLKIQSEWESCCDNYKNHVLLQLDEGGVGGGGGSITHNRNHNKNYLDYGTWTCYLYYTGHSGAVMISCLTCFLKGGSLRRFRYGVSSLDRLSSIRADCCSVLAADPVHVVLWRAHSSLRWNTFDGTYHLFRNNCIHFAFYCKTGRITYRPALVNHTLTTYYYNCSFYAINDNVLHMISITNGRSDHHHHDTVPTRVDQVVDYSETATTININNNSNTKHRSWQLIVISSFNSVITRMVSCFDLVYLD